MKVMKEFLHGIKDTIGSFPGKLFNWMKVSNRELHCEAGLYIFAAAWCIGMVMHFITTDFVLNTAVMAAVATAVGMASVEYIQDRSGIGKWDNKDIAAGMFYPVLFILLLLVVLFIKNLF